MSTIEERAAEAYRNKCMEIHNLSHSANGELFNPIPTFEDGYIDGATEQKQIDDEENGKALLYCTDKTATRVAKELIEKFKDWLFDNAPHSVWEEFVDTHAFEGISENEKEIPYNSCNSDKNLQELTWKDIKRIVEIATEISGYFEYRNGYGEEYYTEVLRRFKEDK